MRSRCWHVSFLAAALILGAVLFLVSVLNKGPSPTPPPHSPGRASAGWPGPQNTGAPAGTVLKPYPGPCTIIVDRSVIDSARVACDLVIRARDVTIVRSAVVGRVISNGEGSVRIIDSSVDGGGQDTFPTIGQQNITLVRVDVTGGQHSVQCQADCSIEDSWLHDQAPPSMGSHQNGFISNGGRHLTLRHNTISCSVVPHPEGGGCTADVSLFGDFGEISNVLIERNLFVSNSEGLGYCAQLGNNPDKQYPVAADIVVTGNVFERGATGRCGRYGPVTAFGAGVEGNIWSDNTWVDGTPVDP